ncbi:SDR family NAD(P)-dependent oxidoreductase [Tomitella cavernea]|uniref:SDR family NAD(P)-dependent oxidoreductase n=1 Tax=Tomitella cavernea TaxID=1387982 RepID=UPI003CD087D3
MTGAGRMRSIGRAIAAELARSGADVVLTGTSNSAQPRTDEERDSGWRDVESVAAEVRELGTRAVTAVTDIADEDSVRNTLSTAFKEFGGVDILVNNAAAARAEDRVPVTDLDTDVWDRVLRINLRGTFLMSKHFARQLVDQGHGGSIVNISSLAGKLGSANSSAYCASKAAVQSLTSSMAQELGGEQIRVNALCPGIISTSRLDDLPQSTWAKIIADRVPLGRAGSAHDVAAAVAFLTSDEGRWITGQSWNIDGGQLTIR